MTVADATDFHAERSHAFYDKCVVSSPTLLAPILIESPENVRQQILDRFDVFVFGVSTKFKKCSLHAYVAVTKFTVYAEITILTVRAKDLLRFDDSDQLFDNAN